MEHNHNDWLESEPCRACHAHKRICKAEGCDVQQLVDSSGTIIEVYDRRSEARDLGGE